ncbi:Spo7-like protein-domain-containing protein [Phyllosticta capitalensis]|uniref:Spo7-like protein-domain-containing protein n=2 Tax=Phyllosticta capitalensis TaxID=121624 RepID=A0ABR1YBM7_9PEZI
MSESKLDQIVKGAPPPSVTAPQVAQAARQHDEPAARLQDPTSLLPSSPPQIYLNLLILEASMRSQYLTLRARRRQNTFVLAILVLWIAYFGYAMFLRPREDGGVGGSVYWVVDMGEKLAFISGVVMGILFWGTGQWDRGVRWPRRWIGVANRGLRSMNCKIVLIRGPWWKELLSYLNFLSPYQLLFPDPGTSYQYIDYPVTDRRTHLRSKSGLHEREFLEEDVAPGGDYVKLLLLPKPFSADFRQNWEMYRTEYWEKENERRAHLRERIRQKHIEIAKQEGGWLWWTGWRGWRRGLGLGKSGADAEKSHHQHSYSSSSSRLEVPRDKKRRPSILKDKTRDRSNSHSSSRSTTPTLELDDRSSMDSRRWSNSTADGKFDRRKRKTPGSISKPSRLTPANPGGSRPTTPSSASGDTVSRLANSISLGEDSDRSATLTPDENFSSASPSV